MRVAGGGRKLSVLVNSRLLLAGTACVLIVDGALAELMRIASVKDLGGSSRGLGVTEIPSGKSVHKAIVVLQLPCFQEF